MVLGERSVKDRECIAISHNLFWLGLYFIEHKEIYSSGTNFSIYNEWLMLLSGLGA